MGMPGMWRDRYSRQEASVIQVSGIVKLLLSRGRGAAEPNTLQIIGGFVATESLFFASSGTGLTTVLLITDSYLDFH
jgi:hypothetical protein